MSSRELACYYKHMYFESRSQAGQLLAAQLLEKYRYENCAVLALSDGAVLIGEQIAAQLHCPLTMLLTEDIAVPGEDMNFGAVSQSGNFTYNSEFSTGEVEEYASEFHGYLDEQKREAFTKINRLLADGGVGDRSLLEGRTVILVSDGFDDGAVLAVALDYLKPVSIEGIVAAAPVAIVPMIDLLHVKVDEMHILDVKENYMGKDHYYEDNTVPTHEETVAKINQIVLNWR